MERTFTVDLSSTFEDAEKIPDFVDQISEECSLDEEPAETFKLILSEAVTNAILHGNKEDPDKSVHVDVKVSEASISADVKDEGSGFDPNKRKNPLKDENLLDIGGRGLLIIREFSDHLEFKENGTKIHFRVNL